MRIGPGRGITLVLLFLLAPLAALAQGVTINVIHDKAQGVVRINGVPVHYFTSLPPFDTPATNAFNIGLWAMNGDNKVEVDAAPVAGQSGAETEVALVGEPGDPPIFEQTITGKGTVSHVVNLSDLPKWAWMEADAFSGPDSEVLAAVAALHKAHADKSVDAVLKLSAAAVDDMTVIAGPMPSEARADMEQTLREGKLAPLPAKMTVQRFLDNRLIVVNGEGNRAPVEITTEAMGNVPAETGRYWVRRKGVWSVVRWQ